MFDFLVFIGLVLLPLSFSFLCAEPGQQVKGPQEYNLSQGRLVTIPAKTVELPLYIFPGKPRSNKYIPSGYMGDVKSLTFRTVTTNVSTGTAAGRTTSLKISYKPKGREGWAGIYWLAPANNWGKLKGAGFNLSQADRLTFKIRGETGGEKLAEIKIGGVGGPFPDTDSAGVGPLILKRDWEQVTIPLKGKDLRHIVGGFMFIIRRSDNLQGASFFLDEIVFRGTESAPKTDETANNISPAKSVQADVTPPKVSEPQTAPNQKNEPRKLKATATTHRKKAKVEKVVEPMPQSRFDELSLWLRQYLADLLKMLRYCKNEIQEALHALAQELRPARPTHAS